MTYKKIAILGATSHIAKNLIDGFYRANEYELFLFARSPEKLDAFLKNIPNNKNVSLKMFNEINHYKYDVIINCVGIGDPGELKKAGFSIFKLTETFDNMILEYLESNPSTLYINFSSGAAYGMDFSAPVDDFSCTKLDLNNVSPKDFYGIAKIYSEAKHRALKNLNIVDLRVFGFFSRFINLETKYFISEVISCARCGKIFETLAENMVRDYVHPQDLTSLIERCIIEHSLNDVFDVYSLKPVTKFEILDYFSRQYGLKYSAKDDINISLATGAKDHYYSNSKKAEKIGYYPQFTSLSTIIDETRAILEPELKFRG